MTASKAQWLEASMDVLADVRKLLAPYGLPIDPALQVVADSHPCPGYLHQDRAIAFCPPVIESKTDELRWLFFRRFMGCESLTDAAGFYRDALPMIICHEAAHHLRQSLGIPWTSHFVEEQVCDRLAVAMVEAMPAYRDSLKPLRSTCEKMLSVLTSELGDSPGAAFVLDTTEVLVRLDRISRSDVEVLEDIARRRRLPADKLLNLLPSVQAHDVAAAEQQRSRAQQHIDTCYTRDPAEYWHLSLSWVASYLARVQHPGLVDVVREGLLDGSEVSRVNELVGALWGLVDHPERARSCAHEEATVHATRRAAAEALIDLTGAPAIGALAEMVRTARESWNAGALLSALVDKAPQCSTHDLAPVDPMLVDLFTAPPPDLTPESMRLLVRLAGLRGTPLPNLESWKAACSARTTPGWTRMSWNASTMDPWTALDLEATAAQPSPSSTLLALALGDEQSCRLLLSAWHARRRALRELPADAIHSLMERGPTPAIRRLLLQIADDSGEEVGPGLVRLALVELRGLTALGTASAARSDAAMRCIRRAEEREIAWQAVQALPLRGSPAWRAYLTFPVRESTWAAATEPLAGAARLRALSFCADKQARAPEHDPRIGAAAQEALGHARWLIGAAHEIERDRRESDRFRSDCVRLAVDVLRRQALDTTLELLRDTVTFEATEAVAVVTDECRRGRIPPGVAREWLLEPAPKALAGPLHTVLSGALALDVSHPKPSTADLSATLLPAIARDVLRLLDGERWRGPSLSAHEDPAMSTVIERLVYLRAVPLFARMDPERLQDVAAECVFKQFPASETVFREGDRGDEMFIVVAGQVALERQTEQGQVRLAVLGTSDCFGEMALFDGAPRSATAMALTDCRVLALSGRSVSSIGRENPEVYETFLEVLSARLRHANIQIRG